MTTAAEHRGVVGWFAQNPVAANLLMLALLLGGVLGLLDIRQEITPDFTLDGVQISMSYPGASPEEVEEGIVLAIERELTGMTGIDTLSATASEGSASVTAELDQDADAAQVLQDIRNAISRITSFPEDAERPKVELRQHGFYVISIGVAAELAPTELYKLSRRIRRQVLDMDGVSEVDIRGALQPQISVEISQETLRAQGLTLEQVASRLRSAARDVPAGQIKTGEGEILLRTLGRREQAADFANIPIKTRADGTRLLLGDIAQLHDAFEDSTQVFEFNGRTGMRLDIYQAENQEPVQLAQRVRKLVRDLNTRLPNNVTISVQNDRSERYAERRQILLKNGLLGLLLVVVSLGIFLNPRLAFWVAVSIPVVFIGSFAVLPFAGVTLNMISMFAFILAVGIVVDDAIIVGENIHARVQEGLPIGEAVQLGAREMVVPVIYAVGTNIIAFLPLLLVPGAVGQFMRDLPLVASIVFAISLLEALLVLPSHLNHQPNAWLGRYLRPFARLKRFHDATADSLDRLRDGGFSRLLERVLRERYLVLAIFGGLLALVIAWNEAGRIDLKWRPAIPGNRVDAELNMPVDASLDQTLAALRKIEAAGLAAVDQLGGRQYIESWFTRAGWRRPTYGDVNIFLVPDDQRPFTQAEFTRAWREQLGDLPEAKSLFFEYLIGPGGNQSLAINLSHSEPQELEQMARQLAGEIKALAGVVSVSDGIGEGKRQLAFEMTAEGRALGLDESSLGRQLRHAFYGAEVQRILRGGDEIKVMVRLPQSQRLSLRDLRRMIVRAPDGTEIPLLRAATINEGRTYSQITREDGRRILKVSADIDKSGNSRQIRELIEAEIIPALQASYPDMQWKFAGSRRDRVKTFQAIFDGLLWSALLIFALLAALFRSYSQGLIVMATIPFAVAGAIAGHVVMGHDLSSVSIYGMIALGGLVVNGALVLTVRLNQLRDLPPLQAIARATRSRFRPILLTTLTTTMGLLPMLFETSTQALFLVPMAIALTFGTLTAFLVVLLLIPVLHAIADDIRRLLKD